MPTLVSWNCNMAFRKKRDRILECDPDVLIVQECESPAVEGDWSSFADWRWIGENEHKGLAVFVRNGLSLDTPGVDRTGGLFTLPVRIDGAIDVVGVWAMNDEQQPRNRYIGQVYAAVRQYRDFLDGGAIVAGDFNWNVQWDESPKYELRGDFADTTTLLEERGLESAYHASTDSEFGNETEPTFFLHKRRERSYHTDYVFVPDRDDSALDCTVGEYGDWNDASDHMPVFVEW